MPADGTPYAASQMLSAGKKAGKCAALEVSVRDLTAKPALDACAQGVLAKVKAAFSGARNTGPTTLQTRSLQIHESTLNIQ